MPPKSKKNAPPATPKKGAHKSRRKPQPPPEIQSTEDLSSMDESSTMTEFRQTLGGPTAALVTMSTSTRLDTLSSGKASPVDITSAHPAVAVLSARPVTRAGGSATASALQMYFVPAQPGTRAGGTDTASAFADSDMEQSLRNMVEHRVSTAHHPALAITEDETDGEMEVQTSRGATSSSGKLRSAVHKVIWPHECVYTSEGQPSEYESMCSLAFVKGYMTIMDMHPDSIRKHNHHVGTSQGPDA